jgi:hypothetical protein
VGDRYPLSSLRPRDCHSFYRARRELTVVLANPAPVEASWRVLFSYRSSFEGGDVVVGCLATARGLVRGCVRGTVAVVATPRPRALQQHQRCRHSARRGAAVAGMAAQG